MVQYQVKVFQTEKNGIKFTAKEGTTQIYEYWSDIMTKTIRADKLIESEHDLNDVVNRFLQDPAQFDYYDFTMTPKLIRANREYESFERKIIVFFEIVFEYEGQIYRTQTRQWNIIQKIQKKASRILKQRSFDALCLVSDLSGDVISIIREVETEATR